jgi:uncharacterized repeat protein (TIGR03803 family)
MKSDKPLIVLVAAFTLAFGSLAITTPVFAVGPEKVLHSFCSPSKCGGSNPFAGLIFDSAGNLYGTTSGGQPSYCYLDHENCGAVFELTLGADGKWTEKVLYRFCSASNCTDGANPIAGLIFDSAGNLYGTTSAGGQPNCGGCGTVFELTPGADGKWTEKVLYRFCSASNCTDGAIPYGGLIFDSAGNLYGTTNGGGSLSGNCPQQGCGTVFEVTPGADGKWTEKVLHNFTFGSQAYDGSTPEFGSLIFDKAGHLYGTTFYGGRCIYPGGCGTVFQLTHHAKGGWTERVIYSFQADGRDGYAPYSGLILDAAGNLYGTTYGGGRSSNLRCLGCGTVFQLTPGAHGRWKEKVLHSFNGNDGSGPAGSLIFDAAGNLYGNTNHGGAYDRGTVFRLNPKANGNWTETIYSFKTGNDGDYPDAGLIFDSAGDLYGTTYGGGTHDGGIVYEIRP